MKHNGAIDMTRVGFTALCNCLLCSNDQRYGLCNFFIYLYEMFVTFSGDHTKFSMDFVTTFLFIYMLHLYLADKF